jgi:hypothetical protein
MSLGISVPELPIPPHDGSVLEPGVSNATKKLISFDENLGLHRVVYLIGMKAGVVFSQIVDPLRWNGQMLQGNIERPRGEEDSDIMNTYMS